MHTTLGLYYTMVLHALTQELTIVSRISHKNATGTIVYHYISMSSISNLLNRELMLGRQSSNGYANMIRGGGGATSSGVLNNLVTVVQINHVDFECRRLFNIAVSTA